MTTPEKFPYHPQSLPPETPTAALPVAEDVAPIDAPETTATPIRFRRIRQLGGTVLFAGGLWCAAWAGIHGVEVYDEYREAMSDRRIAAANAYDKSDIQQAINADLRRSADNHIDNAKQAAKPMAIAGAGAVTGVGMGWNILLRARKPKPAKKSSGSKATKASKASPTDETA